MRSIAGSRAQTFHSENTASAVAVAAALGRIGSRRALPGLLGRAVLPGDLVGEGQAVATGAHSYNEVLPLMLAPLSAGQHTIEFAAAAEGRAVLPGVVNLDIDEVQGEVHVNFRERKRMAQAPAIG